MYVLRIQLTLVNAGQFQGLSACVNGEYFHPPFTDLEAKCRPSPCFKGQLWTSQSGNFLVVQPCFGQHIKKCTSPMKFCFSESFLKVSKINLLFLLTMNWCQLQCECWIAKLPPLISVVILVYSKKVKSVGTSSNLFLIIPSFGRKTFDLLFLYALCWSGVF